MLVITATITLMFRPDPHIAKAWTHAIEEGQFNERLADIITIEPGFGVDLLEIEDVELSGEDQI